MLDVLRKLTRREGGGALVELAVALPLLVIILAATIDFGRVFRMSVSLTNAARAGALYGAQDAGRTIASIESTAVASTNEPDVIATATKLCECADDSTAAPTPTSPVNTCTATCAASHHMVLTVTVTTRKTFTTLMNVIPGMPTSFNLSRSATLRVAN